MGVEPRGWKASEAGRRGVARGLVRFFRVLGAP